MEEGKVLDDWRTGINGEIEEILIIAEELSDECTRKIYV